VAKVAQSATATWAKPSHVSKKNGVRDLFKTIFFTGIFLINGQINFGLTEVDRNDLSETNSKLKGPI